MKQWSDTNVTIFTDNAAALRAALDPGIHPLQASSIAMCSLVMDWLSNNNHLLRLSWCPSHVGIVGNVRVDRQVNSREMRDREDSPSIVLVHATYKQDARYSLRQSGLVDILESWIPPLGLEGR
ncbi:hypothetical protein AMATHDRAFT_67127 [Amanita thiersii Skay4041]|uniref:RNase H type-1 domain-containing protein n=1 Tax=Amanita thiersii Skay4041 TaxID=703135 RepID=A0A2A9NC84_9AGAR|nr:hypothetical protein AMATHDRAFT_67127 [Amanita thiersii Skay4041]